MAQASSGTHATNLRILLLAVGAFGIINTEMGITGILPAVAGEYGVTVATAGLLVSMFALAVAFSGPIAPLLCSRFRRKTVMLASLVVFTVCSFASAFVSSFPLLLALRIIPAIMQPVYTSFAFSEAAFSVREQDAPKATAKVMMGVSAGMVLGVPCVNWIVSMSSVHGGMLFCAAVNGFALLALIFGLPSGEQPQAMSYGSQLKHLLEGRTWLSILGVVALNGAVFGVFSYFSEYLGTVTGLPDSTISLMLLVYGLMNIVGNMIAGRELVRSPRRFVCLLPFPLAAMFALLFIFGAGAILAAVILVVLGVLAGCVANVNQYWISVAMLDAPEFANGLFLAATNLGTMIGTQLVGALIDSIGSRMIPLGGIIMLVVALPLLLARVAPQIRAKLRVVMAAVASVMLLLTSGCAMTNSSSAEHAAETQATQQAAPQQESEEADGGETAEHTNGTTESEHDMNAITITVNGQSFTATLADTETARAFAERLPMTLTMDEMNGNEKYHYLDESLPSNSSNPGTIHTGDLMLYGSDCVVLFYKTFQTSYSYTRIGSIDNPDALAQAVGRGNASVTFSN
ncbi:cyclophilin-like fold protein [Bifidobacterium oedipodis]|uniref:MFS transporter n=1 Tax=Bifidobacterium oedipodis TaxID=2675322 RepID=A0A7Y0EQ67_9BIFI|nr:cyclophilin-like fold protein [Bifidobacterium sp. DSM 109957]NMM94409.1 MFS transporter [Bifidobacterium sp. DSM 109957]